MIKAIIFDFFGVVVSEGFKQFRDNYFPGDEAKWKQAIELVNKHDSGQIPREDFVAGMAQLSGKDYAFVSANINRNQPNRVLIDYIKRELKAKYKISILSNSGDDYVSQMLDPADLKLFDDILLSYKFRMLKPQPEIFQLAADRLNLAPAECLFIDDSPSHCEGARGVGMQAIWYQSFDQMKRELEEVLSSNANN